MSGHPGREPGSFWDERYAEDDYVFGHDPNQWMAEHAELLQPGMTALVPGDGEGRNGVWLAERGLQVTTIDASPIGVEKAQRLAAARGVDIEALALDLRDWDAPQSGYDVAVLAFLHVNANERTEVHRIIVQTLKPGGLLLLEGFAPDHIGYGRGGPKVPDIMFTEDRLRGDFEDLLDIEVLDVLKSELPASERHGGPAVVARLRGWRKTS